jgi:hypothetical protein
MGLLPLNLNFFIMQNFEQCFGSGLTPYSTKPEDPDPGLSGKKGPQGSEFNKKPDSIIAD